MHQPFFAALRLELAEQEKAALAIKLDHLGIECGVVGGGDIHHADIFEAAGLGAFRLRSS